MINVHTSKGGITELFRLGFRKTLVSIKLGFTNTELGLT